MVACQCPVHKIIDMGTDCIYVRCMSKTNGAPWNSKDGKRLRAFRQGRKWSQMQLAIELGCDQATVSRIEDGRPPARAVRKLIEMLTRETTT